MELPALSLLFLYFAATPATCLSNETDSLALLAFKNAIIDDPLWALRSWNETVHFCDWKGIMCSKSHRDRVVSVNLRSCGLVGSLPPHLGNLSFLRAITVQKNSFYGEIPEEFGRLRRLEFLDFSNNSFSGGIPRNLSRCPNLSHINLVDNHLTGIIIPELGSMFKLEALGLAKNNLSGTIPPFIGNLTNLSTLTVAHCGLQGEIPDSLVNLRSLWYLNLANNDLTCGIPSGLYNISSIANFIMGFNRLQGKIPWDIGFTLPNLTIFHLGANDFDGPIPLSLYNASFLEVIFLFSNRFTGENLKYFNRNDPVVEIESESNRNLSITQKLNIVFDVAYAVEYLHHGTNSIVIHGDLKPSNILLDENMTAHVGDFGLAKVVSNIYPAYEGSSSSVAIKGTIGYIPPEYGMTNSMTMQGGVYSFGILVLEMFTNIKPTDDAALNGHSSLHHLVNHALHSQEMNTVDQIFDLHNHTDHKMQINIKNCLNSILEIGVACSMELPKDRMTMTDVVVELDKIRTAYLAE